MLRLNKLWRHSPLQHASVAPPEKGGARKHELRHGEGSHGEYLEKIVYISIYRTGGFVKKFFQNSPVIAPVSSMSILHAAGSFGKPGMVMISPVSATTKPAPALT